MTLKIVSWNIENITRLMSDGGLEHWHRTLGSPDVLCLQELRVRAHDADLVGALEAAIPGWTAGFSLNRDHKNGGFRGGRAYGVGTWVRACLRPTYSHVDWDREGRVLLTSITDWGLVVINVYAVNGTSKPYFDHDADEFVGDRHRFKRQLIEKLGETVAGLQRNTEVILIGDWNVSQTRLDTWPRLRTEEPHAAARREFADDFVGRLKLVDAFRALYPTERRYTWFNPRSRGGRLDAARVDFALVSRSLLPCVTEACSDEPAATRAVSDHVPIRLELQCSAFC